MTIVQKLALTRDRETLLEKLMQGEKEWWWGLDVSITDSLDYGIIWTKTEMGWYLYFLANPENREWTTTHLDATPEEIRERFDWIDWDGDENLFETMSELRSYSYLDICGEAYEGFLTEDEVLCQLLEAKC